MTAQDKREGATLRNKLRIIAEDLESEDMDGHAETCEQAATLIDSQAARIAELERESANMESMLRHLRAASSCIGGSRCNDEADWCAWCVATNYLDWRAALAQKGPQA